MTVEHRTTDTDELAPYPGMTGDDLAEFEAWTDEVDGGVDWHGIAWTVTFVVLFVIAGLVEELT